jgi:sphingolipid C9-methyltransferase
MATARLSDLVDFRNQNLASRYARRIPMATLLESYIDGDIDIPDIDALLDARDEVVTFDLTAEHVKFFVTRMIPEWLVHSQAQDKRIVRDHYDRGDDFFEAFLGDSMIYTGAYFQDESESLETAQQNKMNRIGEKLGLRPEHEVLDIGCGWGTLVAHSAKQFGAKATGITISERGAKFGNDRIQSRRVRARADRVSRLSRHPQALVRPHRQSRDGRARRYQESPEVLFDRLRPPRRRRPLSPPVVRSTPRRA